VNILHQIPTLHHRVHIIIIQLQKNVKFKCESEKINAYKFSMNFLYKINKAV